MTEIHLYANFQRTLERLRRDLLASGLQVDVSFDLQSARQAMRNPAECTCPHHGTTHCTCQYAVLLVRRAEQPPLSLVIHGHENRLYIRTLAADPATSDAETVRLVQQVLLQVRCHPSGSAKPVAEDPS